MTITEKEIREDFARFIRHEAMRANCTQEEVRQIITGGNEYPIKVVSGKIGHKGQVESAFGCEQHNMELAYEAGANYVLDVIQSCIDRHEDGCLALEAIILTIDELKK